MIQFETGKTDPRNQNFDHHNEITKSDSFIAKMASVQFIEWFIITKQTKFDLNEIEFNHVGHMDDFVLFAIPIAIQQNKLRNLYAWACRISAKDSLGPCADQLLNDSDRKLVDQIYQTFQDEVSVISQTLNIDRWKLTTDQKLPAAQRAASFLVHNLETDQYTPPVNWIPDPNHYEIHQVNNDIWSIKVLNSAMNPLRASGYFYNQGCKILIAWLFHPDTNRWSYSISARSAYDIDLTNLWNILQTNEIQANEVPIKGSWGGHSGAGGSPRACDDFVGGSALDITSILNIIHNIFG